MEDGLRGKVAVITGSTRGFGRALAEALLQAGARVVISGRRAETVESVLVELGAGEAAAGQACDVSQAAAVYALGRFAAAHFGRIDIWVNNAGISPSPGGVADFPPEVAAQVWRVNALGTYHGTQTALYYMRRQESGGVIVNLYGMGSTLKPGSPAGIYAASKAWITSFTRTAAQDYASPAIRFVGFSPGMMRTRLLMNFSEVVGETAAARLRRFPKILAAFANSPEEPARVLVDLLAHERRPFVEFFYMRGWRMAKMLARLLWLSLHPSRVPPLPPMEVQQPYEPPLAEG